jgi:hypothetical protein
LTNLRTSYLVLTEKCNCFLKVVSSVDHIILIHALCLKLQRLEDICQQKSLPEKIRNHRHRREYNNFASVIPFVFSKITNEDVFCDILINNIRPSNSEPGGYFVDKRQGLRLQTTWSHESCPVICLHKSVSCPDFPKECASRRCSRDSGKTGPRVA